MPKPAEMPSFAWHWRSWKDVQSATWFTKMNWINIVMFVGFIAMAIRQVRAKQRAAQKAGFERRYLKAPDFPEPEELKDFDWRTTEPVKIRQFKPKYHLTMGKDFKTNGNWDWTDESALENLNPTELILMDKTYEDRIKYRRWAMKEYGNHVVNVHDDERVGPAVRELYTYLLGTYLPLRYPDMFKVHQANYETGQTFMFQNLITGEMYPATPPASTKTTALLEILGRTVDEDFAWLMPEEDVEDPKYVLQAHVVVCPQGWDPLEKIGLPLASIHKPVPGYKEKLEGSMDRFFTKVEVGKYVKRSNWAVTVGCDLYAAGDAPTHAHEGEVIEEMEDIDIKNVYLRCERQSLHRLPKSKALVFAFKTLLYPIEQIKEESSGPELADAIDGLKAGSVPAMHFYKRGAAWGKAVKKYLRS